jgi:hypothetical protein
MWRLGRSDFAAIFRTLGYPKWTKWGFNQNSMVILWENQPF